MPLYNGWASLSLARTNHGDLYLLGRLEKILTYRELAVAYESQIQSAKDHFGTVLEEQLARVENLTQPPGTADFSSISPIKIGMLGGDGIGPIISEESQKVLEYLLRGQLNSGKLEFRVIDGLTIENRAAKLQSIPDDVLGEIKDCHVTLIGPTHTPEQGDGWPNLESANFRMPVSTLINPPCFEPRTC